MLPPRVPLGKPLRETMRNYMIFLSIDEIVSITIHLSSSFLFWKIHEKNFGRCQVFPGNFNDANLQNDKICHAYLHLWALSVFRRLNSFFQVICKRREITRGNLSMQDYGLAKKTTWPKIRMDHSKCYGKSKLIQEWNSVAYL